MRLNSDTFQQYSRDQRVCCVLLTAFHVSHIGSNRQPGVVSVIIYRPGQANRQVDRQGCGFPKRQMLMMIINRIICCVPVCGLKFMLDCYLMRTFREQTKLINSRIN